MRVGHFWPILLAAAAAQETCDGGWPIPAADAPCTALHDIIIAFDTSMKSPADDAALDNLLRTIVSAYTLSLTGPRIGLVRFSDAAEVVQPLTAAGDSIETAITNRHASTGNTCGSCGLQLAQDTLAANARAGARKVIIFLSTKVVVARSARYRGAIRREVRKVQ